MIIHKQHRDNPFVMIDKRAINDDRLSWKATGLLAYLLSKPPDWHVNVKQLVKAKRCGRDAVLAGLRELRSLGYAQIIEIRSADGKIRGKQYVISEEPDNWEPLPRLDLLPDNQMDLPLELATPGDEPETENPTTENPDDGFSAPTNNVLTENEITENENAREEEPPPAVGFFEEPPAPAPEEAALVDKVIVVDKHASCAHKDVKRFQDGIAYCRSCFAAVEGGPDERDGQ